MCKQSRGAFDEMRKLTKPQLGPKPNLPHTAENKCLKTNGKF